MIMGGNMAIAPALWSNSAVSSYLYEIQTALDLVIEAETKKNRNMKLNKILLTGAITMGLGAGALWAADHIDAPAVTGKPADIADLYVFQGSNPENLVFATTWQPLLSPASTGSVTFDENTMFEFNIDNNNDNVEDLVIQMVFKGDKMYVYGPVKPAATGFTSTITGDASVIVKTTSYASSASPVTATTNGITAFAGPRDDPFFFDLDQYKKILAGTATSFNKPGNDTFKGTNVLAGVVEVPKSLLKSTGKINVWVESKKKI
jgi:hypothetical protein